MPEATKNIVELFSKEKLSVNKVTSILSGDHIGFNNRACWNHLHDVRQKIDVGDAQWAFDYFQKRQLENPQSYYVIQCDGEARAVNFFWVDARSRMSYQQFGDVVTFDTTYKTNKYKLSFAPFTRVNHHFQTIQFGCALLQDETENSFVWLFETWKKTMGGVAPISIITDSDLAIKAVIPKVFPNTRHRLCYWHIKKKFGEKVGHVYFQNSGFKKEMKNCLKKTFRVADFEKSWGEIMIKYELTNNSWLEGLYQDRVTWIPVYNRTTLFAGMSSTGHSEGINAFFKDYINRKTCLMEFVQKWLKGANKFRSADKVESISQEQIEALRLSHLCQEATQWACIAYKTEEGYQIFLDGIKELSEKVSQIKLAKVGDEEEAEVNSSNDQPPQILLDPHVSLTKGRTKDDKGKWDTNFTNNDGRYKSPIEISQDKNKRKCTCCNTYASHNSRTCPKRLKVNDQGVRMANETFDLSCE